MTTELDIPARLPVDTLSVSSVSTYLKCPEKWRRRYIEREYEPPNGAMILGSAVGAAEGWADQQKIDVGVRPGTNDVLDAYTEDFDYRSSNEEVDWGSDKPGNVKDVGVLAVTAYERDIVPSIQPVSVEREVRLDFEGVDWGFKGFLDLEEADGTVVDRKVKGKKLAHYEADVDIQPTAYLLARRSEGNPSPVFKYHTMVKTKTPYAEVVPTVRTDVQLDSFVNRLYKIASEIQWRMETEVWSGAVPGSWYCSEKFCGYWPSCAMGGLR